MARWARDEEIDRFLALLGETGLERFLATPKILRAAELRGIQTLDIRLRSTETQRPWRRP
jgi:hypothetical protein